MADYLSNEDMINLSTLREHMERGYYSDWHEWDHIIAQTERWTLEQISHITPWKRELTAIMTRFGVTIEWWDH